MEIIPGVHSLDKLGTGRAYLYAERDRLTLIDTGLAGSTKHILDEIERLGRRPEDVRQIVITHHHFDHIGALGELIERTNAQVLVHAADASVVRGERTPPGPNPRGLWHLLAPIAKRVGGRPRAGSRVDRELSDGDEIDLDGGAKIVHVPGHTMGSIAVYLPQRRMLFAGDAATNSMGLGPPSGFFSMFNEDHDAARASFRKLAQFDFDVACFGHGPPLDKGASAAFRRAAEKLGR